jgi:methyl coenzyme M reductase subunit C
MALWELYAGGGLSKTATSQMGSNLAVRTIEFHNIRRRKLLKSNLSSGLIKPQDLSEV